MLRVSMRIELMLDSCDPSKSVAMFNVKLNLIQTLVQSLLALYLRLLASAYLYVFALSTINLTFFPFHMPIFNKFLTRILKKLGNFGAHNGKFEQLAC